MPDSPRPSDPLARELFDALLVKLWDEQLNEQDAVVLGQLLRDHVEFRQEYLEAKHSLANLTDLCKSWQHDARGPRELVAQPVAIAANSPLATLRRNTAHHVTRWLVSAAAISAAVLVGVLITRPNAPMADPTPTIAATDIPVTPVSKPPTIATVVDAVSTDIVNMMPVFAGRELTTGQVIELDAGITELRFRCGANAVLTGPARLAIEGPKRVRLDVGRLTVTMDEGVDGFQVYTPDGKVTDLGTSFGVSVTNNDKSEVAVFEGVVELESDRKNKTPKRLLAGEAARFSLWRGSQALDDEGTLRGLQNVSLRQPDYTVSAFKDAYVRGRDQAQRHEIKNYGDATELLIKYEPAATQSNRRAWMSFDLSHISRSDLIGARLRLTVLPNQLAEEYALSRNRPYAESDTTWEFEVAGLWDEYYDDWNENDITWNNAPGNAPDRFSGQLLGPQAPVTLGKFTVHASGVRGEQVVLAGSRLLEFLRQDKDGKVTLIVSRCTPCFYNSGEDVVVHGFASREHGELAAPTLELWGETDRMPPALPQPEAVEPTTVAPDNGTTPSAGTS
ncbi:CBM96 family carbohydrate-binding protein [Aeoliella sp. SH292]|uniref:CBM96 family carbohydrate-binding protein n=1 Tax=Aeoliella sp. SH292 TaxID=3454464 RepID=UPI003F95C8AE